MQTISKWPSGKDKVNVGSISPANPLIIKIDFDEIEDVARLDLVIFGRTGLSSTRRLPCSEEITVVMSDAESKFAIENEASLYALVARMTDGTDRIVTKGRINWEADTKK
jgi:hypothetical protein